MNITHHKDANNKDYWVAHVDYHHREVAKRAGFAWDAANKVWWAASPQAVTGHWGNPGDPMTWPVKPDVRTPPVARGWGQPRGYAQAREDDRLNGGDGDI